MARRGLKLCQTLKQKPGVGATGREDAPFAMRSRYSRMLGLAPGRSPAQDSNSGPWNQLTVLGKLQNLVAKRGQIVQTGIIWGQKGGPLYGEEG